VAKGFQEAHQIAETASPTSKKSSQRIMFSIMASKCWEINMLDVSHAFLQGDPINRDVFVKPPPEANSGNLLWKLKICVYGLPDASKLWYDKVSKELSNVGVTSSVFDPAFFWIHHQGDLQGLICVHVDDFIWGGSPWFKNNVIDALHQRFDIKSVLNGSFDYLGLHIEQRSDKAICVDQLEYLKNFSEIRLGKSDHRLNEASTENFTEFRSMCGKLTWMSNLTRPDLSFDAAYLSSCLTDTANQDIQRLNKVIKNKILSGKRTAKLNFTSLGTSKHWTLQCYSDASHKNLPNGGSQVGCIIMMVNKKTGNSNIVHWFSHRIARVVTSPLAAETLAMNEVLDEAYGLNKLLSLVIGRTEDKPIHAITDSRSLLDHVQTKKRVNNARLIVEISKMRESKDNGELCMTWVRTTLQLADPLTKRDVNVTELLKVL
jgi:hypothetical protein